MLRTLRGPAPTPIDERIARALTASRAVRIVRIIDRLNVGGPARHVVWLSGGLPRRDFDTALVTGRVAEGEEEMSSFIRDAQIEPVVIPEMGREIQLRDVVVLVKLVRLLCRMRPDVVHTHKAKAGALGRVAAFVYRWATLSAVWCRPRRCAVVHTYHGHVFHSYYGRRRTRLFLAIERALARWCTDVIIVLSPQQRAEINERFRVGRAEQFRVIPLGLDIDVVPGERGGVRRHTAADEPLIGIVGRLTEIKNHALFLRVAARLRADGPDAAPRPRFVVVGDGHLRPSLEQLAADLGLTDRVVFTGIRHDVGHLYPDVDVVALTSLNEGTPLTLIEAMCYAKPIAATEVGGVVDLMGARRGDGGGFTVWEHGVTAHSGDAEGLARGLRYLIAHPDVRRDMGERGQAFARARFPKERLVDDVAALYRELVKAQELDR